MEPDLFLNLFMDCFWTVPDKLWHAFNWFKIVIGGDSIKFRKNSLVRSYIVNTANNY
jgi:hypothetical protein